jgi:hypothetical protein
MKKIVGGNTNAYGLRMFWAQSCIDESNIGGIYI